MLHWTGRVQNWNQMCADCHSTDLRKGYDLASDTYDTTWEELDVACESCHGPASNHVAWARGGAESDDQASDRKGLVVDLATDASAAWNFVPGEAIAQRSGPARSGEEIDSCAACHSRRSVLREPRGWGKPFLDSYRPALLDETLYYADGQIQDEVYVWGSFVQSKMYAAGVSCSDCHEPHSLAVAEPVDATCAGCHRADVFATPAHHHHAEESAGADCVGCHMPTRTYMGVDDRHDHSLPRAAARPFSALVDAEYLHGVSHRSRLRVGGSGRCAVVGRRASSAAALRRDLASGPPAKCRRRRSVGAIGRELR